MANQYKNEVIYNGQTLLSLKNDTVTSDKVLSGVTFHDRSGAPGTGSVTMPAFTRKTKTYTNITIPSAGYVKIDSYSGLGVSTSLYFIGMNIAGWSGSVKDITFARGSNKTDFYAVGPASTTITSMTIEYTFVNI